MTLEVLETPIGGNLKPFLDVVDTIYRDDPCFVRPLDMEVGGRLSPKNPYFEHSEGTLFTAFRDGHSVGRCAAHIDRKSVV
jgi:hypothetical protein